MISFEIRFRQWLIHFRLKRCLCLSFTMDLAKLTLEPESETMATNFRGPIFSITLLIFSARYSPVCFSDDISSSLYKYSFLSDVVTMKFQIDKPFGFDQPSKATK